MKKRGEEEKSINKKTGGGKALNDISNVIPDVGVSKNICGKKRSRKTKKRGQEMKSISLVGVQKKTVGGKALNDTSNAIPIGEEDISKNIGGKKRAFEEKGKQQALKEKKSTSVAEEDADPESIEEDDDGFIHDHDECVKSRIPSRESNNNQFYFI